MKPTRILASATLIVSSLALITAAGISVGDEPGVVRMGSNPTPADHAATSLPDPVSAGVATLDGGPPEPYMGMYPQPAPYAPYFERSSGATQQLPHSAYQPVQPFGPIIMFETNINKGLGYDDSYQRLNARVPYHIVPNANVLIGDISASVTNNGDPLANVGLIYRNYDPTLNRIFGWNAYGDYDQGNGTGDWYQVGAGFESLGKYLDFRVNGYQVVGDDSTLLSSNLANTLRLMGNGAFKVRSQVLDNAYSGIQAEVGGPLPILGQYGLNMYVGGYYLHNQNGYDAPGFQARWQALVTESLRVNTYLTTDDTFGTNSWVSLQYDLPNYKNRRVFRPTSVRDRLQDPVVRDNRIHVNRDARALNEAVINAATGLAYNILNVNPNAMTAGNGTFENPYSTLQAAAIANSAGVDIIRVVPRADDATTNLTVNGGMSLFDDQTLLSSLKPLILAPDCIIAADTGLATTLGPLISNPTMLAGGSVVRLGNNDAVIGMRIDAANAAGTVFGNGIVNPLPITDANLTCNIFTNYTNGALLQDVSGRIIVDQNEFNGLLETTIDSVNTLVSVNGLNMTVGGGATVELLVRDNIASNNNETGLSIIANPGSTVNADDPNGTVPTGIVGNTTTNNGNPTSTNGNGILLHGRAGSTINALVEDNISTGNAQNGFFGETDGGIFNLASLRNNTFSSNGENGAFLHYLNGGIFRSVSEDRTEDLNLNGILDLGEDTNGNSRLDAANGTLDAGEDVNGNGMLDEGIVTNTFNGNTIAGLCIFGEDAANAGSTGTFDVGSGLGAVGVAGSGNDFLRNGIAGIAYDLTGFATGQIDAINNKVQGVSRGLSFLIDGDTFTQPWLLTNSSASSVDITRLTLDIAPSGNIWDSTAAAPGASFSPFQPLNNSDITTGLTSVNGTLITAGTNPLTNSAGTVLIDGGVADGTSILDLVFNGFAPQEQFTWNLDVDPVGFPDGTTSGNDLIGSTIQLQFSDGGVIGGTLQAVAGNPVASQFVATSGNGVANGIIIRGADNSVLQASTILNNNIDGNGQWGVNVSMSDAAQAESLDVKANIVTNNGAGGVLLHADGPTASIDASQTIGGFGQLQLAAGNLVSAANQFSRNQGDGFRAFAENGGTINGNLINNTIQDNSGDGVALLIQNGGTLDFGTPASNRLISGNTITGNNGAGIRTVSNVSASSVGVINAVIRNNEISNNDSGGIVSSLNGPNSDPPSPPAVVDNNRLNLIIGGTGLTDANVIDANGDVGIGVDVSGNGLAIVDIINTSVTGTVDGPDARWDGDGLGLRRADSSLLIANVTDSIFTGNAGDGMDVLAQGTDRFDLNQPMSGTANSVTVNGSTFDNNGGNGARYFLDGDVTLISDVTGSSFNGNAQNGAFVQTLNNSSFGDPTDGLPPGRRSIFDGNTFNENGVDGVQLVASDNSRILLEVTSNRIAGSSAAHSATNTNGDTSISRNGRDGVRIDTNGGRSDILITSGTGQTTIDGNGTAGAGGNGIRWNASGTSEGLVRATRTIISNSIAGATEVGDPNANEDVDVADGDGIQASFSGVTTSTLIIGGVGEGNIIQNNEDDGIALTASGSNATGNPRPVIDITGNTIGGTQDGLEAGNGGDGVSLNTFGGTAIGISPAVIDTDANDGTLSFNGGVTESGAIPQLTLTDNLISRNGQRGVNLLLTGAGGIRNRENGASVFDPIRITLNNNTVSSNGTEGIFYRADANMNQSRFVYLANFPFPDPPFNPADDRPQTPFFYDPLQPEFTSLNAGSVNGITAYLSPYLNLRTVQNSLFTVTNNTIQNNGTNLVTGEGLFINVGTGAYVAADVQNNAYGGNLEEDFRTASFLSAGETFTSVDDAGINTFDAIYLDDTAQFDLRFQNNEGNQILPSSRGDDVTPLGATYTTLDPLKAIFLGNFGASNRQADLFEVDNGPGLNDPNNTFINFGVTQNIQNAFSTGGYNIRAAADPLFPNIGFPPFLP